MNMLCLRDKNLWWGNYSWEHVFINDPIYIHKRLEDTGDEEIYEKYMHLAAKSRLKAQHFASGKDNS